MKAIKPTSSSTIFHVSDVEKSIAFYSQELGFLVGFKLGNPTFYAGLSWGTVGLHISSTYPYQNNTGHGNLYLTFAEVDSLYEKLVAAGVEFYSPIGDRDYGMRDFAIKDPDGNQIGIGAEIQSTL